MEQEPKYFIFIVLNSCKCISDIVTLVTVFQNTFEQVRYEVIGDGTAPVYFAVNTITGSITTTQSLSSQSAAIYYVRKSQSPYLSPLLPTKKNAFCIHDFISLVTATHSSLRQWHPKQE